MSHTITRTQNGPNGTIGELCDDEGNFICYTIELPWLDNHPQTSCIPEGTYTVTRYNSPKHGWVWLVQNVPFRSMIEIHPANTVKDLLGCIGVGDEVGEIDGLPAVLNSQITFRALEDELPETFQLTIQ